MPELLRAAIRAFAAAAAKCRAVHEVGALAAKLFDTRGSREDALIVKLL